MPLSNENENAVVDDEPAQEDESLDSDETESTSPLTLAQSLNDPKKMEEFKAALEARTTLQQRATQVADEARQSVIDAAQLDEARIVVLDGIIDDLNRQLEDVANRWIARIDENKVLTASDRTRMAYDISGVLVETSDALDAKLPNWRDADIEPRQLMRHSAFVAFLQLRITGGGVRPRSMDNGAEQ